LREQLDTLRTITGYRPAASLTLEAVTEIDHRSGVTI